MLTLVCMWSGVSCLFAMDHMMAVDSDAALLAGENLAVGRLLLREASNEDFRKAFSCFQKAADQTGNTQVRAWAYLEMAKQLYLGRGVERDKELMLRNILRATEIAKQDAELKEVLEIAEILKAPGFDLHRKDGTEKTALHKAVIAGQQHLVELFATLHVQDALLSPSKWGSFLEVKDAEGMTALQYAVLKNYCEIFKILVRAGANIQVVDEKKRTLLILAVENAGKGLIEALLHLGFSLNDSADGDYTPLQYAAMYGNIKALELLLELGAALDISDKHDRTALTIAVARGNIEFFELLINKGAKIVPSALCTAIFTYTLDETIIEHMVECMISRITREDVNRACSALWQGGWAPIHYAADRGNFKIIELLLNWGADISLREEKPSGRSPLRVFLERGDAFGGEADVVVVKLMIAKGARIMETGSNGRTALHVVAGRSNFNHHLLEYLLSIKQIAIDVRDDSGATPLMLACNSRARSGVRVLIDAGAGINLRDEDGRTPFHHAVMSMPGGTYSPIAGTMDVIKMLIAAGAEINVRDNEGRTSLSMTDDKELVEFLLTNKAAQDNVLQALWYKTSHIFFDLYEQIISCCRIRKSKTQ